MCNRKTEPYSIPYSMNLERKREQNEKNNRRKKKYEKCFRLSVRQRGLRRSLDEELLYRHGRRHAKPIMDCGMRRR